MRICSMCKLEKPDEAFSSHTNRYCRYCRSIYQRKYHSKDPEKLKAYKRTYYKENIKKSEPERVPEPKPIKKSAEDILFLSLINKARLSNHALSNKIRKSTAQESEELWMKKTARR